MSMPTTPVMVIINNDPELGNFPNHTAQFEKYRTDDIQQEDVANTLKEKSDLECEEKEEEKEKKGRLPPKVRTALIIFGSITGFIGLILLLVFILQRNLLFHPSTDPDMAYWFSENDEIWNWNLEAIDLKTKDGVTLHNYWIPADKSLLEESDVPFTILFCHGNAGHIGHRAELMQKFRKYNVFMLGYRGYGKSTGTPTEAGLKLDAQTALDWIHSKISENEKKKVIVFGQSLGGAVATFIASENPEKVKGLIVENSFLSVPRLLSSWTMFLQPLTIAVDQVFDSATAIAKVKVPILFLSSENDELISPKHMEELHNLAGSGKKTFAPFPECGHNDTCDHHQYIDTIDKFLSDNFKEPIST